LAIASARVLLLPDFALGRNLVEALGGGKTARFLVCVGFAMTTGA